MLLCVWMCVYIFTLLFMQKLVYECVIQFLFWALRALNNVAPWQDKVCSWITTVCRRKHTAEQLKNASTPCVIKLQQEGGQWDVWSDSRNPLLVSKLWPSQCILFGCTSGSDTITLPWSRVLVLWNGCDSVCLKSFVEKVGNWICRSRSNNPKTWFHFFKTNFFIRCQYLDWGVSLFHSQYNAHYFQS